MNLKRFTFLTALMCLLTFGAFQVNATPADVSPVVTMPMNGTDTTITITSEIIFTDNGGHNPYTGGANADGKIVFLPSDPTKQIKIEADSVDIGSYNYLKVFYDDVESSTPDYTYDSDHLNLVNLISTNSNGAMTFRFTSIFAMGSYQGWVFRVSQATPAALSFGSVTASDGTNTDKVLATVKDIPMVKTTVVIDGDQGSLSLDNMTFDASNTVATAFDKATLYLTTDPTFSTDISAFPMGEVVSYISMDKEGTDRGTMPTIGAYQVVASVPELTLEAMTDLSVNAGETITTAPVVSGGLEPYTYIWTNELLAQESTTADLNLTATNSEKYTLTVTDANDSIVVASVNVNVIGSMVIGDFEDLYLDSESHWAGTDNGSGDYSINTTFYSGSFSFINNYTPAYSSWALFAYGNETSTTSTGLYADQYFSAAGHGADDSENFGIAYISDYSGLSDIQVTNATDGAIVPGLYITNAAFVKYAIEHGDGMSTEDDGTTGAAFALGDYLRLNLYGIDHNGDTVGTKTVYLADYRNTSADEHYALDTWQWVDLSSFGAVKSIRLGMESTKANSWGMTTPTFVDLDNIGASCPEETTANQSIDINTDATLSIPTLLTDLWTMGNTTYTVLDQTFGDDVTFSLSETGVLSLKATTEQTGSFLIKASNKGRNRYFRIPVTFKTGTGLEGNFTTATQIFAQNNQLVINSTLSNYSIKVYSINGSLVANYGVQSENTILSLPTLSAGIYMVRLESASETIVRKININE